MEIKLAASSTASILCNILLLLLLLLFCFAVYPTSASLSFNFYAVSCPAAEVIVQNTVRSASSSDPTIPGKLLRLLFHDCLVDGCDASVLIEGRDAEKNDPGNKSLGGFAVIDSAKRWLEIFCPGVVSCADILALAARDAVAVVGGPAVQMATGRRDGVVSSASNVRPNMVDTSFTVDELLTLFSSKGLSLDDLVTLSGAHTIGTAHCGAFSDRFKQESGGNLTLVDTSLDRLYADELSKECPASASASTTVHNDPETWSLFDNQYYRNLLAHRGLFQSDSVLFSDGRTRPVVERFANDQASFFQSWAVSFLKLASVGVKTGDQGQVRSSCSAVNA